MDVTYWHKQTAHKPLYPDLLWSRPENKATAGKLLIVGGNKYGFVDPADAFRYAEAAGIGTAHMLLPDSLRRYVGKVFTAGELAPSTPSGSFSQEALALLLEEASWADGVLLAGSFGRNSETAILLEKFLQDYSGQLTLTRDGLDYSTANPRSLLQRPQTTVVASFAQLQRIAKNANFVRPFTFDMDMLRLVDSLHEFTLTHQVNIIIKHLQTIFVAVSGEVSSTNLEADLESWRVKTATAASVWWLQNPSQTFPALSSSIVFSQN